MRQPQFGPGWGPVSTPTRPRPGPATRRKLVLPLGLVTLGLFTGLLRTKAGIVALVFAYVVIKLLADAHAGGHTIRALGEYVAVSVLTMSLAVALFGAQLSVLPTTEVDLAAMAPTPAEAQTKVQEYGQGISDFIKRATAERGAQTPGPKKEHR